MPKSVLVFCGGDAPSQNTLDRLPSHDLVVAADSGIDHALGAGLVIDVAVGDFDSVSSSGLELAKAQGAGIAEHRPNKDETDFELALSQAIDAGASSITVIGIEGGRLDHQYANLLAIANPILSGAAMRAITDEHTITVIHGSARVEGEPGDLLSLLPVGGDVTGITTDGLTYPLANESLPATSCRGISNTFESSVATITIKSGVLLAIDTAP